MTNETDKPQILVTRPYMPPRAEFDRQLDRIWDKHWLTNDGPLHQEFIAELLRYFSVSNLTLTVNGHSALETALTGLKITGEVITTPFTFASTTHAIVRCGGKPVFADIRRDNLTIDPASVESLITEKTTAIVPVHVYGHPCDTDALQEIAEKHNLALIYDAAHTFGVKKNGAALCSYGDASILSFHATKLFHSIEGGAIVYDNPECKERFEALKNFGILDEERVDYIGGNAKMNEFQAAMGLTVLPHIPDLIKERETITKRYRQNLGAVQGLTYFTPDADKHISYNFAYMPVLIEPKTFGCGRDELYAQLKKHGIFTRRYFWPLTCDYDCYRGKISFVDLPVAREISSKILCLPIYNGLSTEDISRVCSAIKQISQESK